MMGCANQVFDMSLYEYEERLFHWNEAHDTDDVEPPDPEQTQALLDRINADPRLTGAPA